MPGPSRRRARVARTGSSPVSRRGGDGVADRAGPAGVAAAGDRDEDAVGRACDRGSPCGRGGCVVGADAPDARPLGRERRRRRRWRGRPWPCARATRRRRRRRRTRARATCTARSATSDASSSHSHGATTSTRAPAVDERRPRDERRPVRRRRRATRRPVRSRTTGYDGVLTSTTRSSPRLRSMRRSIGANTSSSTPTPTTRIRRIARDRRGSCRRARDRSAAAGRGSCRARARTVISSAAMSERQANAQPCRRPAR